MVKKGEKLTEEHRRKNGEGVHRQSTLGEQFREGNRRLISETIQRPKNVARVVITLEVEVEPELMKAQPNWIKDASDVLRKLVADRDSFIAVVVDDWVDSCPNVTLLNLDVQVSK